MDAYPTHECSRLTAGASRSLLPGRAKSMPNRQLGHRRLLRNPERWGRPAWSHFEPGCLVSLNEPSKFSFRLLERRSRTSRSCLIFRRSISAMMPISLGSHPRTARVLFAEGGTVARHPYRQAAEMRLGILGCQQLRGRAFRLIASAISRNGTPSATAWKASLRPPRSRVAAAQARLPRPNRLRRWHGVPDQVEPALFRGRDQRRDRGEVQGAVRAGHPARASERYGVLS